MQKPAVIQMAFLKNLCSAVLTRPVSHGPNFSTKLMAVVNTAIYLFALGFRQIMEKHKFIVI